MLGEQITFKDLVDLKELKFLFEQFSTATGFTAGLVDQVTNEVLLSTGWRDICMQFHRCVSSDSLAHCKSSNNNLTWGFTHAGEIHMHHCVNDLVDGCIPVIIQEIHYANLFTGQVFFTPPDKEHFRNQALQNGYEEQVYLESIAEIPVISEERFTAMLRYLACTVSMLAETGLAHLKARNESARREAFLQSIFTSAPVGIGLVANRVLQWTNKRMLELTGYTSNELEGQESSMLYQSEEEHERVGREKYAQILVNGTGSIDTRFKRKDGSIINVHLSSTPIDQKDLSLGVTFTALDITERKKAEEILLKAKTEWEGTFDAMPDVVTIQDKNFSILRANKAACSILGLSFGEIVGHHCYDLFHGSQEPCYNCPLLETKETFEPYSREMYHEKLGKTFLVSAAPVFDKQGKLKFVAHVAKDISDLKESEEDRIRLVTAIDQAFESVVVTDKEGCIQYVNPAFEQRTGYSRDEVKYQNSRILKSGKHDSAFYKKMWTTLLRGDTWKGHLINKKKNGSLFEEEATISPVKNSKGQIVNFVAVKRDVSKEVSLEKQLRQAMKMEAIGTLAGGIAHDFNNILAAILGYSTMARDQLAVDDSIRKDLDQVIIAGGRAADLVKQILTFSRQEELDLQPLQVHFIIKEALKLLRSSLPATIQLKENIDTSCGPILADPTQIHQVLMNICTNAKHAIADEVGVLSVSLSEIKVTDSSFIVDCPQITSGTYLDLEISDTGYGMDGLTRSKIFDPFFTTKAIEEGTGLGLAVVHGIVKQHKGEITVASALGQGTVFHIYLPVIASDQMKNEQVVLEDIERGSERILLVDDEPVIANMLERMLSYLGYTVTVFTSSNEAFAGYQKKPDDYDLVITDMTMPEMTGIDLTRKLLALRPELPVVLCTGFSEAIDEAKAKSIGIREYVMKPVERRRLSEAIRKALSPS